MNQDRVEAEIVVIQVVVMVGAPPRRIVRLGVAGVCTTVEHWHPAVAGSRGSHPALYDGGGHALYDGGGPALYDGGAGFAQTASEDLLSEVQLLERQLKLLDGGSSFPQPVSHHGAPPRREEEEEEEEEEVDAGSESKSCLGCFGRPKRAASPPAVAAISAAQNAAEPARLVDGQRGPGPLVLPTIVFAQFAGTSLWFAPNAVVAQIEGFGGSELSILTSLVQVGFVAGTFLLSVFGVTDRVSAPILFGVMSLIVSHCLTALFVGPC
ncbi:hypothetical protein T484DRAFT_1772585 [Baffinella frigidus]|nr:hypothetical protein T484DRAFT_1772585 [Cryptophyta sp. CCMP2293]